MSSLVPSSVLCLKYMKSMSRFLWTNQQLLDALKILALRLGRSPKTSDLRSLEGFPNESTFHRRFGSFKKALLAAGLDPNKLGRVAGFHHSSRSKAKMSQSHKGKAIWNKGRILGPLSQEHREKLSQSLKGRLVSDVHRKRISAALIGKRKTPEHCQRIKESRRLLFQTEKGRKLAKQLSETRTGLLTGEKNPNWKGGISFEPYDSGFNSSLKERIRRRDRETCQLCRKPGRTVHHIDYNKKNSRMLNLITLCRRCNSLVNSNRDFWSWYLGALQLFDYERIPGVI